MAEKLADDVALDTELGQGLAVGGPQELHGEIGPANDLSKLDRRGLEAPASDRCPKDLVAQRLQRLVDGDLARLDELRLRDVEEVRLGALVARLAAPGFVAEAGPLERRLRNGLRGAEEAPP